MPSPGADSAGARDDDALRAELRRIASLSHLPVIFGGHVRSGNLVISEFIGTRTNSMRNLAVAPTAGLGGAAMATGKPRAVADYRASETITHDYDAAVQREGMRAVAAVPVLVDGKARAVLYAGDRERTPIGGRVADLMVAAARRLSVEFAIRDEVDRRVRRQTTRAAATAAALDTAVVEELRDLHAELRGLAHIVSDDNARDGLRRISDRLTRLVAHADGPSTAAVALTPRELDVLAHIALGCTNSEVALRLSLTPETVKSYLRNAMTKLGTHNRHATVVHARRLGLLP
jgi:DNA-binding CsgD family transcriptional regulator